MPTWAIILIVLCTAPLWITGGFLVGGILVNLVKIAGVIIALPFLYLWDKCDAWRRRRARIRQGIGRF